MSKHLDIFGHTTFVALLAASLSYAYRRADYHLASEFQKDVPEQWEDWHPRNAALLQRVEAFIGQPCSIGRFCPTYTPTELISICPDYSWLTWPALHFFRRRAPGCTFLGPAAHF